MYKHSENMIVIQKGEVFLAETVKMIFQKFLGNRDKQIKKHTLLFHLPLQVTQGHFSQTTLPNLTFSYPGTQCCIVATNALLTFQQIPLRDWTKTTVDEVIITGDKIHFDWITVSERSQLKEKRIAVEELPTSFLSRGQCFKICLGKIQFGTLDMSNQTADEFKVKIFEDALDYCLSKRFNGALLTIQDKTMALVCKKGFIYLFDSHGYNSLGKPERNGRAILAKFVNIRHFIFYIKHREHSSAQFNLVPVNIKHQK